MLKLVLVDDEQPSLQLMQILIANDGQAEVVGTFSIPSEVLQNALALKPDAVFLDIEMPGMSGIELAGKLIEQDKDLQVVFITAYNQYALEAFKVNKINYIMKPSNKEELSTTLLTLSQYKKQNPLVQNKESFQIRCFGGFELMHQSGIVVEWASKRTEELLAYFIIHRNIKISKQEIGVVLWPKLNEVQLNYNFYASLFRLRKTLQEEGIPIIIQSEQDDKDVYNCCIGDLKCDLIQLDEFVIRGITVSETNIATFEDIINMYKGELFKNQNYVWSIPYKEKYVFLMTVILDQIASYYLNKMDYDNALETINYSLKLEPYKEKTHQRIMEIYYHKKDKQALVRHYKMMKELFKRELKVRPDIHSKRLYKELYKNLKNGR